MVYCGGSDFTSRGMLHFVTLQLSIKGYNHKQPVLLKKIFERMANFQVDPKRFPLIKERVRHLILCTGSFTVQLRQLKMLLKMLKMVFENDFLRLD